METIFNNFVNLFVYFDTYSAFERFCIIGSTVCLFGFVYYSVNMLFKIFIKILQFVITVAMIVVSIAIIGCLVWLLFNAVILGNVPV